MLQITRHSFPPELLHGHFSVREVPPIALCIGSLKSSTNTQVYRNPFMQATRATVNRKEAAGWGEVSQQRRDLCRQTDFTSSLIKVSTAVLSASLRQIPSRGLSPPQATDTGAFSEEDSSGPCGQGLHLTWSVSSSLCLNILQQLPQHKTDQTFKDVLAETAAKDGSFKQAI